MPVLPCGASPYRQPMTDLPALPAENDPLPVPVRNEAALAFLATRRSTKVIHLAEPGPDRAELERLLLLAMRVPDHGKIGPWRWVIVAGEARARVGAAMALALKASNPAADDAHLAAEAARWQRAPVVAALVSCPVVPHKIPVWEQELSAGALAQNALSVLHAAGWGACWLTGWNAYDPGATAVLGVGGGERIAGLISIGTATEPPTERIRPDLPSRIRWLD
jgi:nitroreductase